MDWLTFIKRGFRNEKDHQYAERYFQKNTPNNIAKEDSLDVFYRYRNKIKEFTVCCACGNSRMVIHENGVRCHSCGLFHSHDAYNRQRLKAKKLARNQGGKIEVKPQPFIYAYTQFREARRRQKTARIR